MRFRDFETLVRRLSAEVPASFYDGVAEVVVSPRAVPHPVRGDIWTLGECVPIAVTDEGADGIQSRIVLYHGSFAALAELAEGFDWRHEAWETLTHELRHHLEWRARAPDLEAYDAAAEHNFARADGETFDPVFFLDGEVVADGVYKVDDDYFLDRPVRGVPDRLSFVWHGRTYGAPVPAGVSLPAFLTVDGIQDPPPGDLIVVLRSRSVLRALLKGARVHQARVTAERLKEPT